jgi:hypothetical protein
MPLAMSTSSKPEVEGLEAALKGLERALDRLEAVLERMLEVVEGTLEVVEALERWLEGPGVEPGATSGESINTRRGCESLTEERDKRDNSHHRRQTSC